MLKKDTIGNASAKSLDEAFKCGECLHFQQMAHGSMKTICKEMGVRAFAVAPKCFTPDVTQLSGNTDRFVALASILHDTTPKQKRILLGMLRSSSAKSKLAFGTKVYFLSMGRDYISNYLSGYVLCYTSSNQIVVSGSPDQKSRGKSYLAYFNTTEELLSHSQWVAKRKELKEKNRIQDPKNDIIMKSAVQDYEPPTLDAAPAAWHDKREATTKKRSRTAELEFRVQ